ncbi:MAG TPA: hypothetical protein PJ986_08380 [Gammaproteobacteria bacterium]|nr:hypothetical protein [Gammaproteobacteria bacterium]
MYIRTLMAATLAAMLGGVALDGVANDWRQPRSGQQWRSPPAWGNTPGPVPRGAARVQGWRDDGYPSIQRDRQRWRDNPHDRHESRDRDDWHEQGRDDDWRDGGHGWRDDDREWRGGVVRRRDRDDYDRYDDRHEHWPPPAYGPYAPAPGYDDRRGPYEYRWRRYDDY